jgi:hypothetical protein
VRSSRRAGVYSAELEALDSAKRLARSMERGLFFTLFAGVFDPGLEKEGLPDFTKASLPVESERVGSEDVCALAEVPLR